MLYLFVFQSMDRVDRLGENEDFENGNEDLKMLHDKAAQLKIEVNTGVPEGIEEQNEDLATLHGAFNAGEFQGPLGRGVYKTIDEASRSIG